MGSSPAKISGWFDLLFVNVFGLPFNTGMLFFVLLLTAALFWGCTGYSSKRQSAVEYHICFV